MCQLHGGDIGVSSIEGEGSTFGFFFRARRSDGSSEGGRPPFITRRTSESSNHRSPTPVRPPFSRANSTLQGIKESPERPKAKTLTSHPGVDSEDVDGSLKDPPTEDRPESHPECHTDDRYCETQAIAEQVKQKRSSFSNAIEGNLPDLQSGETERQEVAAEGLSKSQSEERSDVRRTLLLVEDNLINQKVLRRQLQSKGFEVRYRLALNSLLDMYFQLLITWANPLQGVCRKQRPGGHRCRCGTRKALARQRR